MKLIVNEITLKDSSKQIVIEQEATQIIVEANERSFSILLLKPFKSRDLSSALRALAYKVDTLK